MSENGTDNGGGRAPVYSAAEFADAIGRSRRTLYTWDKEGLLRAHRYPSGRPFYTAAQLQSVLAQQSSLDELPSPQE